MRRRLLILPLATVALVACSRSEAQQAADASYREAAPSEARPREPHSTEFDSAYEALLSDDRFMQEVVREMGGSGEGRSIPCEEPPSGGSRPADWASHQVLTGMSGIPATVHTPPHWSEYGSDADLWAAGVPDGSMFVYTPPTPPMPSGGARAREVTFAALAVGFEEVVSVERIDPSTCLVTGLMGGAPASMVMHIRLDGEAAAVMGAAVPGTEPEALAAVLRLVEFG